MKWNGYTQPAIALSSSQKARAAATGASAWDQYPSTIVSFPCWDSKSAMTERALLSPLAIRYVQTAAIASNP